MHYNMFDGASNANDDATNNNNANDSILIDEENDEIYDEYVNSSGRHAHELALIDIFRQEKWK